MKNFIKKVMSDKAILLTYEEILRHPIGQKVKIAKGFRTERLPTTKNVIFFRVELDRGVEIPLGIHDCFEEFGLYYGKVRETFSGEILSNKKNFKIPPYTKHGFLALENSIFYAYLYM